MPDKESNEDQIQQTQPHALRSCRAASTRDHRRQRHRSGFSNLLGASGPPVIRRRTFGHE
jgi:hypothetical protein